MKTLTATAGLSFPFKPSTLSNPMRRKILSFLFVALAYAIAGYAFFLIFFKSQF
jgi:hypothetical protein